MPEPCDTTGEDPRLMPLRGLCAVNIENGSKCFFALLRQNPLPYIIREQEMKKVCIQPYTPKADMLALGPIGRNPKSPNFISDLRHTGV